MLTQQSIRDFLAQSDYDIRESGQWPLDSTRSVHRMLYAPLLTLSATMLRMILLRAAVHLPLKKSGILNMPAQYVEAVFKKPAPKNKNAKHEYDKFFQQPMEMSPMQKFSKDKARPT